jgi:hypothetical protein
VSVRAAAGPALDGDVEQGRSRAFLARRSTKVAGGWLDVSPDGHGNLVFDRWVATTVKVNPAHLEGAKGLRVGIVPARGGRDAPTLDEDRNLIICPLPYDGAFMEIFYRGFGVVQQVLRADAKMPREVALPNSADRQVARLLIERRNYPVLDVVGVLDPLAQPELLVTDEVDPELVVPELKAGRSQKLETGGVLAPIARENS